MIKLAFFLALGYMLIRLIRTWFRIGFFMRTAKEFQEGLRSAGELRNSASPIREKDITDRVRTAK